jgi:ribosome-binding factor A
MSNVRHHRVCELLKRQLGEIIRREFNVSEVGLITVNDVSTGGDFKAATVFLSILGNPAQQKRGLATLESHRARIQDQLAKSVVLKFTPKLRFLVDDSIVRGNKVLQILNELEQANPTPANQLVTEPKPDPEQ